LLGYRSTDRINRWSRVERLGGGHCNTRFQPAAAAQLTAADVPRLKLKWAFGYPGAASGGTQPVVVGNRVYVGTAEGDLYSLDAKSGCVRWTFQAEAGIRSAVSIGRFTGNTLAAYFGDQSAYVYAVDADTGRLWKKRSTTILAQR
jgi:polyvinyl alcohol dehydrogenase (cytochrome)